MCLPVKPYKVEREWKHAGLSCAVVLAREAGYRCAYVRVPPGHPAHGKEREHIDVDVHGGLTFDDIESCTEHEDGQGHWFGFDCAHFMDAPYDRNMRPEDCMTEEGRRLMKIYCDMERRHPDSERGHYWTQPEVEAETERLADQLAAMVYGPSGNPGS